jgi:hypothetical protein
MLISGRKFKEKLLLIMLGGVMDEMLPDCWPECVLGVMSMSGRKCPEDPLFIMLGGVMEEMFPGCWPECVLGVMLIP